MYYRYSWIIQLLIQLYFVKLNGQDLIFVDNNLYEGSICETINEEVRGVCSLHTQCHQVQATLSRNRICGFKGSEPLVCCPTINVRTFENVSSAPRLPPALLTTTVKTTTTTTTSSPISDVSTFHPDIIKILLGIAPPGSLAFGQDPGPSNDFVEAQSKCGTNGVTRYFSRNLLSNASENSTFEEVLLEYFKERYNYLKASNDQSLLKIRLLNRFNSVILNSNLDIPLVELPALTQEAETTVISDYEDVFLPDSEPDMIFGAVLSLEGQWPWMVLVGEERESTKESRYPCDGVFIDPKHVIAAAHCVDLEMNVIKMGIHDLNKVSATDSKFTDILEIEKIFIHPDYKASKLYNDIAIIKIKTTVNLKPEEDAYPAAVCLPGEFSNFNNYGNVTVLTWGGTKSKPGQADILRAIIDIPVVPNPLCEFLLRRKSVCPRCELSEGLPESVICIGDSQRGQQTTCMGTTGGPAIAINKETRRWTLLGVVASKKQCSDANSAHAILTNIQFFLPWIKTITGNSNLSL